MKWFQRILTAAALAGILAGCSDARFLDKPPAEERSFVYGYIDMDDAPTDADWVHIRQFAPKVKNDIWSMRTHDGVFYIEKFGPGSYGVIKFGGGGGFFTNPHAYGIPRQDTSMRLVIKKPGIYYLGTFKYKHIDRGFFQQDSFDIEKADTPTEKEVLKRIIEFAKGSGWEQQLKNHLAGLK